MSFARWIAKGDFLFLADLASTFSSYEPERISSTEYLSGIALVSFLLQTLPVADLF